MVSEAANQRRGMAVAIPGAMLNFSHPKQTKTPADPSKWLFLASKQGSLYPCSYHLGVIYLGD
jgi:hypothetical protein